MACQDCVAGVVRSGKLSGHETKIHGFDTYISEPKASAPPKGIVVIVCDVFGWTFPNTRLLADDYAKKGNFIVYVPDFTHGDSVQEEVLETMDKLLAPGGGITATLMKPFLGGRVLGSFVPFVVRNRASVAQPRVLSFFEQLRTAEELPIGVAGFCWGGLHSTQLTHSPHSGGATTKPLVDAAFTAHPVGLKLPSDIAAVQAPLSFAIGSKDMALNMKGVEQIKDLLRKKEAIGIQSEVVVYDGAKHGFAIRGNPNDEKEKQCGVEACDQAVAWECKAQSSSPNIRLPPYFMMLEAVP
ncbi:MAG: hypothetical protein M1817_006814 [Caeruleum heppii]|nr:MAG: hypothetical protein M1817_006814 [Caeruleum heppii]